jgi:hypothetical protein
VKDRESLEPKKTRRVWNRKRPAESKAVKDQERLEPKKTRIVESETEKDQENLESVERRPGESGIGRGKRK